MHPSPGPDQDPDPGPTLTVLTVNTQTESRPLPDAGEYVKWSYLGPELVAVQSLRRACWQVVRLRILGRVPAGQQPLKDHPHQVRRVLHVWDVLAVCIRLHQSHILHYIATSKLVMKAPAGRSFRKHTAVTHCNVGLTPQQGPQHVHWHDRL